MHRSLRSGRCRKNLTLGRNFEAVKHGVKMLLLEFTQLFAQLVQIVTYIPTTKRTHHGQS